MSGAGSGNNRNPNDRDERARREKDEKARKDRASRNLLSAMQSRERKTMLKAHLTSEKARLQESNAILRAQLDSLSSLSGAGPSRAGSSSAAGSCRSQQLAASGGGPSGGGGGGGSGEMLQLSDNMSKLFGGRKQISSRAAVDLLDRALSGGANKPPPVDADLVRMWDQAQERAPKTRKPKFYDTPAHAAEAQIAIQAKRKAAQEKKKKEQAAKAAKRAAAAKRGSSSKRR